VRYINTLTFTFTFTYKDRLKWLKFTTVKYRRIRGDMIEVYKIMTNKYDSRVNLYLEKQQDSITRAGKNL